MIEKRRSKIQGWGVYATTRIPKNKRIIDPSAVDPAASMPAYGGFLTDDDLTAIVTYLAARK